MFLRHYSLGDGRAVTFVGVDHLIDMAETVGVVDVSKYTSNTMKQGQTKVETSVSHWSLSRNIHNWRTPSAYRIYNIPCTPLCKSNGTFF